MHRIRGSAYKQIDGISTKQRKKYSFQLKQYAQRDEVSLQIDYGSSWGSQYMAVFASYINDEGPRWEFKTIPVGFEPTYKSKDAENVSSIQVLRKYNNFRHLIYSVQ